MSYVRPVDFKYFEIYISTVSGTNPTGWDGTSWAGAPNDISIWDGITNTLFKTTTTEPITIVGLTAGTTYYTKIVAVDKQGLRSIPGPEITCTVGDTQRSSNFVVAASDASTRSKAGADYVCSGTSDQEIINAAIDLLENGGTVMLTEGTFICDNSVELINNISLTGQGAGTIFNYSGSVSDVIIITNKDKTGGNYGISIKNFAITNCSNCYGIYLQNISNIIISEVFSTYNKYGMDVRNVTNLQIINCTNNYNTVTGINVDDGTNCKINLCYVEHNTHAGIVTYSMNNSQITNCNVNYNGGYGIIVSPSSNNNNTIGENHAAGNGININDTYSNIYLAGYDSNTLSENNVIQNNICRSGDNANKPRYGIHVCDPYAHNTLVANNDCYQSGVTAGILDTGTSTNFGAGNRNNDGTWSTTPN
jgi:hypothetical protein